MADNVPVTPGTGADIATDDVGGAHFQRVKLDVGGDGASSPVTASNPLPTTELVATGTAATATWTSATSINTALTVSVAGYESVTWALKPDGGTASAGTIRCEISMDGVEWVYYRDVRTATGEQLMADFDSDSTPQMYSFSVAGAHSFRLRLATVITGTMSAGLRLQAVSAPAAMSGGQMVTVSGSVSLVSGTQNIGDVDVLTVPAPLSTTGGGTEATALRVTVASDSTGVLSVDDNGASLTVDGTVAVSSLPALAAGTNNIGDVDVLSMPVVSAKADALASSSVAWTSGSSPGDTLTLAVAGLTTVTVYQTAAALTGSPSIGFEVTSDGSTWYAVKGTRHSTAGTPSGVFSSDEGVTLSTGLRYVFPVGAATSFRIRLFAAPSGGTLTFVAAASAADNPSAPTVVQGPYASGSAPTSGTVNPILVAGYSGSAVQYMGAVADNGGFTDGTTPVQPAGFIFDEVAGTALTENDAAAARVDSKRAQVLVLEDATTRGQRAAVSSGGALKVAANDTAGQAQYNFPAGFVRTTDEPHQVFYDPFDSALDTTNRWNAASASGGGVAAAVSSGVLTLGSGTTINGYSTLSSQPSIAPTVPGWLGASFAISIEFAVGTNALRFWGMGTAPGTPTTAAPLTDAYGFELTTTGVLKAVVYANGVRTEVADLASVQPGDALYHRYIVYYRTDRIYWYIDSLATPVATSNFQSSTVQTLPVRLLSVAHSSAPASSRVISCTGLAVWDTAKNGHWINDGTFHWRRASVSSAGALAVAGEVAHDAVDSGSPQKVGLQARSSLPTAVASADRVNAIGDLWGRQMVTHIDPTQQIWKQVEATTAQTGTAIWTPAAGKKVVVTSMEITTGGTTAGVVTVWAGASGDTTFSQGTDQVFFRGEFAPSATSKPGVVLNWTACPRFAATADHVLRYTTSAGITLYVTCYGYEV